METEMIATVKETGKRYLIEARRYGKIYCWGEVINVAEVPNVTRDGTVFQATHDVRKIFLRKEVDISEVTRTMQLLTELASQRNSELTLKLNPG